MPWCRNLVSNFGNRASEDVFVNKNFTVLAARRAGESWGRKIPWCRGLDLEFGSQGGGKQNHSSHGPLTGKGGGGLERRGRPGIGGGVELWLGRNTLCEIKAGAGKSRLRC